jgi:hypothetical protein
MFMKLPPVISKMPQDAVSLMNRINGNMALSICYILRGHYQHGDSAQTY